MSQPLNWDELVQEAAASSTSFDPIPPGEYEFKIIEATAKLSSNDNQMYVIKAEVQSGAHARRLVWDNLTISPTSASFFFRKMNAIGLPKEFFTAQRPTNEAVCAALMGRTFRGKVIIDTSYNPEGKNKIDGYAASAGVAQAGPSFPAQAAPRQAPAAPPAPAAAPPQFAAPAQGYPDAAPVYNAPAAPPAPPQQGTFNAPPPPLPF